MAKRYFIVFLLFIVLMVSPQLYFIYRVLGEYSQISEKRTPSQINFQQLSFLATDKTNYVYILKYESGEYITQRVSVLVKADIISGYDVNDWKMDTSSNTVTIPTPPKILSKNIQLEYVCIDSWLFDELDETTLNEIKDSADVLVSTGIEIPNPETRVRGFLEGLGYICYFSY